MCFCNCFKKKTQNNNDNFEFHSIYDQEYKLLENQQPYTFYSYYIQNFFNF